MILDPRFHLASVLIMVLLSTAIMGCGPRQKVRALYNEHYSQIEHIVPESEACLAWAPMLSLLRDHEQYNDERLVSSINEYNAMYAAGRISSRQYETMVAPFREIAYQSNLNAAADLSQRTGWTYEGVQYCKGYTMGSEDPSLCWGGEHMWKYENLWTDDVFHYKQPSWLGLIGYCLDNDFGS